MFTAKRRAAPAVIPEPPATSQERAAAAFAGFSASRFAADARPAQFVAPGADVVATQRQLLKEQLGRLVVQAALGDGKAAGPAPGLTIALSAETIHQLLPSFNQDKGTVELDDVMALIARQVRSAEFVSGGNPVLGRIALRAQAQAFLAEIIAQITPEVPDE